MQGVTLAAPGPAREIAQDGGLAESILAETSKAPTPMLNGDGVVLWGTFIGAGVVFLLVLFLLMRMRAKQGVVAAQRAKTPVGEFFQPAGEDAEITFDDGSIAESPERRRGAHQGDLEPASDAAPLEPQPAFSPVDTEIDVNSADEIGNEPAPAPERKGPFARLFSRKKKPAQNDAAVEVAPEIATDMEIEHDEARVAGDSDDFAEVTIERSDAPLTPAASDPYTDDEGRGRFENEEWARREGQRRAEDEARARLEAEREERRRFDEAERERAEREAEFERRKREAAAETREREAALMRRAAESDRAVDQLRRDLSGELDVRFAEFGRRLDAAVSEYGAGAPANDGDFRKSAFDLLEELDRRITSLTARVEAPAGGAALGAIGEHDLADRADRLAAEMRRSHEDLREAIAALGARLDASGAGDAAGLREEVAALRRSLGSPSAHAASAPTVQLADIVRNALPPDAYEMRAALSNHRTADCLVRLPYPPGPMAIDARFPVEAFHRLAAGGGSVAAENEFRRTALKHISDVAERLIAPGETAESAIIFLPAETMYTELHARFPDIIQDSYRARVWIVSPTTLMASLHTIRAVLRDIRASGGDADGRTLDELDALRRRVAALEAARSGASVDDDNISDDRLTDAPLSQSDYAVAPQDFDDHGDLDDEEPEETPEPPRRAPFPLR